MRRSRLLVQGSTLLLLIILWELTGRSGLLFPDLFPPWREIAWELWRQLSTDILIPHLKASLYEVGGGLALGALLAIPLGMVLGSRRSLTQTMEPMILYLAVVPKIIVLPVFILLFGIGAESKLAVAAAAAFFPIALLTIAGMREIRPVYLDVGRSVGATPLQMATSIYLPAILGYLFTGLRIGMGAAVTGALLAETKIAQAGLGFLIVDYYTQFRIAEMYSLFFLIFLLAAAANRALSLAFSLIAPLPRAQAEEGFFF